MEREIASGNDQEGFGETLDTLETLETVETEETEENESEVNEGEDVTHGEDETSPKKSWKEKKNERNQKFFQIESLKKDNEHLKTNQSKMESALKELGYESIEHYEAEKRNLSVEELRDEKLRNEEELKKKIENHPDVLFAREFAREQMKASDLRDLQNAFPKEKFDIENMPSEWVRLRRNGFSAESAFKMMKALETLPPSTGKTKGKSGEAGLLSVEQAKNMSREEVRRNFELLEKSSKNWN